MAHQAGDNPVRLTEHDVRSFLQEASVPIWRQPYGWLWPLAGLVAMGLFVLLNLPALSRLQGVAQANPLPSPATAAPAATAAATPTPTPEPTVPPIPDNTVSYPDLGISAPVAAWDVGFADQEIYPALQHGVVHVAGTAKPGQQGTVVIFGHSSMAPWQKGDYRDIFAPLMKSAEGQLIDVSYGGATYRYQVTKRYEVRPDQIEVLESADRSGIRLITCTPVGTSLRRLVVEGVQIAPDPARNSAFQHASFTGRIPGDR